MKPFLKWAGNKYQIIDRIEKVLPNGNRLIEPFVGSGAVFLNVHRFSQYLLSDNNLDLIELYQTLQEEGESFIKYCRRYFSEKYNSEKNFYRLRDKFNSTDDIRLKSALFIYLNKHGFNGLCRYNQKGEFNVPFGRYKKPYFPEKEMIFFYERATNATFVHGDFEKTMKKARAGDVVYCDPPYVPLSATASFTAYTSGGFGEMEQLRLAALAKDLAQRGVTVVISNHDTAFVRKHYATTDFRPFDVQRYISCDGENRGKASEILAVFAARKIRLRKAA